MLHLERLELRRIRFDLCMTYNIVNGLNGLVFDDFFGYAPMQRLTRSVARNSLLLEVPRKGLNARSHSFAERTLKYWNLLSDHEVLSPSLQSFKLRLQKVDLGILLSFVLLMIFNSFFRVTYHCVCDLLSYTLFVSCIFNKL
jgi:hypothetical protein